MDLKWEQKVYQIVLQAQEKSGAELISFLDQACGDDMRTRGEVEFRLQGIVKILENAKKLLE